MPDTGLSDTAASSAVPSNSAVGASEPRNAFVSVVAIVRDAENRIADWVREIQALLHASVTDYEVVVVDNASADGTVTALNKVCAEIGDVQVYCLAAAADLDVAMLAGMEQAIGDYVVIIDPAQDDIALIGKLIEESAAGHDIVQARKKGEDRASGRSSNRAYDFLSGLYVRVFRLLTGIDLRLDAPRFRLLTRRVVNYILQHEAAYIVSQTIAAAAGFRTMTIDYAPSEDLTRVPRRTVREGLNRGMALMVSSSVLPLRLATVTCLGAATLSLLYSVYVVAVYLFSPEVAPGWTTLSLQLSGLFFLLATALAILSEYVVQISNLAARRPLYHIANEFRSNRLTREERLNVIRETANERAKAQDRAVSDLPDKET